MSNTAAAAPSNQVALKTPIGFGNNGVQLSTFEDAYRFSKCVVDSGWAPKGMERPESVLIALQHGAELGLPPMAALQNIAVINGRPGIYGDAALALVRHSGLLESYEEREVGTRGKDDWGFEIKVKRKDSLPAVESFTVADAKTANLWAKAGPWTLYPKRMLKFRARGFSLRDNFGDVLKGLRTVEELNDMPVDVTPKKTLAQAMAEEEPKDVTPVKQETIPEYTAEQRQDVIEIIQNWILDHENEGEKSVLRKAKDDGLVSVQEDVELFALPTVDLIRIAEVLKGIK